MSSFWAEGVFEPPVGAFGPPGGGAFGPCDGWSSAIVEKVTAKAKERKIARI